MRLIYRIVPIILLLLGLVSCEHEPEQQAALYANICLPIENAQPTGRRIMGDPGTYESFELPKYVYIFVMKQDGGEWSVWKCEERFLAEEEWEQTRYYGLNPTRGDSIFQYSEKIRYYLVGNKIQGRVFAICSNKRLTFSKTIQSVTDLEDLLNLKFNTAPDSIQENIQNIYSTPYNCKRNDSYYCSFDCLAGNAYTIDLILYHVAAKVDITWNVADSARINKPGVDPIRLTYMEARRLFNGYAYCFKPMRNEQAALNGEGQGYDRPDIVTASDEGLWWEGRSYFYTIPYIVTGNEDYFPLQMRLCTNGTDKANAYRPTLNMQIDTSDVFVPWLRATLNIKKPLEAGDDTKTVPLTP